MVRPFMRRSGRWVWVLVFFVLGVNQAFGGYISPDVPAKIIKATSRFTLKTSEALKNVNTASGFGAAAAFAQAGGDLAGAGSDRDPPAGMGQPFDDKTIFGPNGAKIQALTRIQTYLIGSFFLRSYPDTKVPVGGRTALGESLKYNADITTDKVTPALQNGQNTVEEFALASAPNTVASSSPSMTITQNPKNNKAVDVKGTSMAEITDNPLLPGGVVGNAYAVSILRDPITYVLNSTGASGSIDATFGDSSNPLSLQAEAPGSFAAVFFDFGTDQTGTLLSFSLGIDFQTSSKDQADFQFYAFDPRIGFSSPTDFQNYLLSNLTFDPSAHSLSASGGIPLTNIQLQPNEGPVTISFTDGALVGQTAVPEPSSLAMLSLGAIGVLGYGLRRYQTMVSTA